jgi:hypothetical protein
MGLAYQVQFHRSADWVARLVKWLDDGEAVFAICYDTKSVTSEALESLRASLPPDRCTMIGLPIIWAGASQVKSTLLAIEALLRHDLDWSHFINLSESDVPLRPVPELRQYLDSPAAQKSHIFFFRKNAPFRPVATEGETAGEDYVLIDHFGQRDRPKFLTQRSALPLLKEIIGANFGRNDLRASLKVDEIPDQNILRIASLSSFDIRLRELCFEKFPYSYGRQWACLHRDFCEWLIGGKVATELASVLSHVLIPDECFFQTAAMCVTRPPALKIAEWNLHASDGEPLFITPECWPRLSATRRFFARKLAPGSDGGGEVAALVNQAIYANG